jgi:hypothetical protein
MEAAMPESLRITERHEDPYAWVLAQAARLRRGSAGLKGVDRAGLSEFLEEWAEEMLSGARSQLVNLMAHMAKVARPRNPAVLGDWRRERASARSIRRRKRQQNPGFSTASGRLCIGRSLCFFQKIINHCRALQRQMCGTV